MSLKIIKPGIYDTIQDSGRYGLQYLGINPGGTMDTFMMHTVNLLAGNSFNVAVLEMSFPAPVIVFDKSTIITIRRADFGATIN